MTGRSLSEQLEEIRKDLISNDDFNYRSLPDYSQGGYPVTCVHAPERAWANMEWMPLPGFTDFEFWRRRFEELSKARRDGPLAWDKYEPE